MSDCENIIEVAGLSKAYGREKPPIYAVYHASFTIRRGETLGLVGESGCGKSTLGRLLLRLEKPTKGTIYFQNQDITDFSFGQMQKIRSSMQMIFQGSSNAFNPYYTLRQIIGEPLQNYHKGHGAGQERCIVSMLEHVGLDGSYLGRYSHELSGGQRQRVGIARALILEPEFVVCDEAVSSIDFALKKQILKLLVDLKKKNGTTYLFISHDMAAVKAVCDRIMVMYLGNILEILPSANAEVIHPYTQALMAATLEPDPTVRREKKVLFKEDGAQTIPKAGCVFQSRCLYARDKCTCQRPELEEVSDGHFVACHYMKKKKDTEEEK